MPEGSSRWDSHPRATLLLPQDGVLHLETGDHDSVAVPGQVAVVAEGVRHRVRTPRPVQVRQLWLTETPRGDLGGGLHILRTPELLRAASRELCDRPSGTVDADTQHALARAIRGLLVPWSRESPSLVLPKARSPRLRRALDWLRARLERPVGLADGARAGEMSERTLQRRCTAELGMSLSSWLLRARMLTALELLADPDLSIADVALRSGYQSPAAFTRAFSLQLGTTPSAWRGAARSA